MNNAIIPIIGAENTNNVVGLFQRSLFPDAGRRADRELSAPARSKNTERLPQGRPNIYDLIGYGSTYVLAQVIKKSGRDLSWQRLIDSLGDAPAMPSPPIWEATT